MAREDNLSPDPLFQTDPVFSNASLHRPKSWTETTTGYIREAKELTMCLVRNERLMDKPYQWHVTINLEIELTPSEIRNRWRKVVRKLRARGVVAIWVMEVSRSNRVHFHLIVSSQISGVALEQAIDNAMPPRAEVGWHKCLQRIEPGGTWQLAHYVTKAKIAAYVNGRRVEDYYAGKRVLFQPKLGLRKHSPIGPFWVKPKAAIWADIRGNEQRIADGLNQPGVRELVNHVHEILGHTVPLRTIERAFGYHAQSEPVRRWAEQRLAGDDGGFETFRNEQPGRASRTA